MQVKLQYFLYDFLFAQQIKICAQFKYRYISDIKNNESGPSKVNEINGTLMWTG